MVRQKAGRNVNGLGFMSALFRITVGFTTTNNNKDNLVSEEAYAEIDYSAIKHLSPKQYDLALFIPLLFNLVKKLSIQIFFFALEI